MMTFEMSVYQGHSHNFDRHGMKYKGPEAFWIGRFSCFGMNLEGNFQRDDSLKGKIQRSFPPPVQKINFHQEKWKKMFI